MPRPGDLVLSVIREPRRLARLDLRSWSMLLREARCLALLPRIAVEIDRLGETARVPEPVRRQLESERVLAARHETLMQWEIDRLQRALRDFSGPVVLLKGAAYLQCGLQRPPSRFYSDLDLMVPHAQFPAVESALQAHGWEAADFSEFEERYYRRWMHELPPLVHRQRRTTLDVHHNILPWIDPLAFDPAPLLAAAVPIAPDSRFSVLAPPDLVLHTMAHQFRNGDFRKALRDLADLHDLLQHFGREPPFWSALTDRAVELGLQTPCYFALRYVERYLGTPIPAQTQATVRRWRPHWPPLAAMDRLVNRAIRPQPLDGSHALHDAANWILIRYPLALWRKTVFPKLERLASTHARTGGGGAPR